MRNGCVTELIERVMYCSDSWSVSDMLISNVIVVSKTNSGRRYGKLTNGLRITRPSERNRTAVKEKERKRMIKKKKKRKK